MRKATPKQPPNETAKRRRKALGLNQADVAERAGIKQSTLSRYERGETAILSRGSVILLALALELDPRKLDPSLKITVLSDDFFGTCSKCGQPLPFPHVE